MRLQNLCDVVEIVLHGEREPIIVSLVTGVQEAFDDLSVATAFSAEVRRAVVAVPRGVPSYLCFTSRRAPRASRSSSIGRSPFEAA